LSSAPFPCLFCLACKPRELSGEAPPSEDNKPGQDHHESNQLIRQCFPTSRCFDPRSYTAKTFCLEPNNGIPDAFTSDARYRIPICSSLDNKKLSNVVPKIRRCCCSLTSTKASRCLSRRVSYTLYFRPSGCSRASQRPFLTFPFPPVEQDHPA
jgi:hypothetical protein